MVPLCFELGKRIVGVLPIMENNPNRHATASAMSFLKSYPKSQVVFVNDDDRFETLSPRLSVAPALGWVLY